MCDLFAQPMLHLSLHEHGHVVPHGCVLECGRHFAHELPHVHTVDLWEQFRESLCGLLQRLAFFRGIHPLSLLLCAPRVNSRWIRGCGRLLVALGRATHRYSVRCRA